MRRTTILWTLGLALLGAMSGWSEPQEGPLKDFLGKPWLKEGQVFADQHAPNVIVTRKGTIVTVFGYPTDVKVRRSEDGGETWGEPIDIQKGINGGGALVNETNGDLFVWVEEKHSGTLGGVAESGRWQDLEEGHSDHSKRCQWSCAFDAHE